MKHKTSFLPEPISSTTGPTSFLLKTFAYFAAKNTFSWLKVDRTPQTVKVSYDQQRKELLDKYESIDWNTYVFFPDDLEDFYLVDDKISWGKLSVPRKLLLDRIVEKVKTRTSAGAYVLEVGSGDGRNINYLGKTFPDINFVGLELSDTSVELSKKMAEKFGIKNTRFYQANACEKWPNFEGSNNIDLIYSSFALEMMPKIFVHAFDQMMKLSKKSIVLFEPIHEYWPKNLRGLASRLRVYDLDRLRGVPGYLDKNTGAYGWKVKYIKRSKTAINPVNEMVEVEMIR
jgi:SAM-dependent methyltransferase